MWYHRVFLCFQDLPELSIRLCGVSLHLTVQVVRIYKTILTGLFFLEITSMPRHISCTILYTIVNVVFVFV